MDMFFMHNGLLFSAANEIAKSASPNDYNTRARICRKYGFNIDKMSNSEKYQLEDMVRGMLK